MATETLVWSLAAIIIGYLLGSVPSAYLAGRILGGADPRSVGDRNVGMANVFRSFGIVAGAAVMVADVGKGALAVVIAAACGLPQLAVIAAGFAAVAGHVWPLFLGFDGGAGVATAVGVALGVMPTEAAMAALLALPVFILLQRFYAGHHNEAPAVGFAFACLLPIALWREQSLTNIVGILAVAAFTVIRVFVWRHARYRGTGRGI